MATAPATVEEYLSQLPEDRRGIIEEMRSLILKHLPEGYRESMGWGMIVYEVPLERYPKTYNGKPLMFAGLASQKNYVSLYLNNIYQDSDAEQRFRSEFERAGKKLDLGKSCLRFRRSEDLALEAIANAIAGTTVDQFIAQYEASRAKQGS